MKYAPIIWISKQGQFKLLQIKSVSHVEDSNIIGTTNKTHVEPLNAGMVNNKTLQARNLPVRFKEEVPIDEPL